MTAVSALGRRLGARLGSLGLAGPARTDDEELLDAPDLDPAELEANLRELAMLNRLPGGTSASVAAIERLAGDLSTVEILDVGTGGGDIAAALARHGRRSDGRLSGRRGRAGRWSVTAVDIRGEILDVAARRLRAVSDVTLALGDARALPYPDGAFDVAHSSLLLHHLEPADAARALAEMRRVARHGVVVNDLQRGWLHLATTAVTVLALARSRYTRHDGLVSARRAYTLRERRELLHAAGLVPAWESLRLAPRVATAARPVERR